MVDVLTKMMVFAIGSVALRYCITTLGDELCPLIEDKDAVHIGTVVFALLHWISEIIDHPRRGCPSENVFVDINADDFVRC